MLKERMYSSVQPVRKTSSHTMYWDGSGFPYFNPFQTL
jgi:hypothetical protein